jgi:hypothetical protein
MENGIDDAILRRLGFAGIGICASQQHQGSIAADCNIEKQLDIMLPLKQSQKQIPPNPSTQLLA